MSFTVGQRVVCVDAAGAPMLNKGSVYTVLGATVRPGADLRGRWFAYGLYPVEVAPPLGIEAFAPTRFRPAIARKTDISIFKTMLVSPPKVDA